DDDELRGAVLSRLAEASTAAVVPHSPDQHVEDRVEADQARSQVFDVGARVLHYEILKQIAAGGMGEVYAARDLKLGRTVALKTLPAAARMNPRARERLLQEARSAAALNHPHIVAVHAIEQARGVDLLIMEYVEGESLAQRLGRGPLDWETFASLGLQAADALA